MFLLTDYGWADELAGVLRATVARHAPGVSVLDLTHGVRAFDVRAGALALVRSVPHLGPGVVVGVVDPGVAGLRRAVALEVRSDNGPRHLVGPDNGLLVWASEALGGATEAVELSAPPGGLRSTFDGRDVFAPAAAALWNDVPIGDLGTRIDPASLERLSEPRLSVAVGMVETEVLWVDGFGNVELSASSSDADEAGLGDRILVVAGTTAVELRRVTSFAAVGVGDLGVIVDANGHLALVGDRSSAALTLRLDEADLVTLWRYRESPQGHPSRPRRLGGGT